MKKSLQISSTSALRTLATVKNDNPTTTVQGSGWIESMEKMLSVLLKIQVSIFSTAPLANPDIRYYSRSATDLNALVLVLTASKPLTEKQFATAVKMIQEDVQRLGFYREGYEQAPKKSTRFVDLIEYPSKRKARVKGVNIRVPANIASWKYAKQHGSMIVTQKLPIERIYVKHEF